MRRQADPGDLQALATHIYLQHKDLALFAWRPGMMPNPVDLRCSSVVALPDGKSIPEFDRFGLFEFDMALRLAGRNLSRVLADVWPMIGK